MPPLGRISACGLCRDRQLLLRARARCRTVIAAALPQMIDGQRAEHWTLGRGSVTPGRAINLQTHGRASCRRCATSDFGRIDENSLQRGLQGGGRRDGGHVSAGLAWALRRGRASSLKLKRCGTWVGSAPILARRGASPAGRPPQWPEGGVLALVGRTLSRRVLSARRLASAEQLSQYLSARRQTVLPPRGPFFFFFFLSRGAGDFFFLRPHKKKKPL